jgi:hypothetical protein
MGDPQGPWQDYGQGEGPDEHVPAHLPASPPWSDGCSEGYSDEWGYDDERDYEGSEAPLRRALGEVVWRYRSAPLWLRATVDVSAVALVVAVVVAGAMALAGSGPSDEVGAFVAPTSTTARPAGTPAPLGATTTSSTTTEPPTTTTVPTTTVPTTTAPPPETTTTTRDRGRPDPGPQPHYDNCFQAWRAGALPLRRGDPGYGPHLDDDNDGIACEWGEGI